ncbi:hypothetical protein EI42_00994 [Thermosporothrix hazakensis]|jgi:hypothetical protein|uniref:DUF8173 domain-containing protein n=2 Tax=Thermosporothrix TaxID=768650 RepID=A0A326UE91_THEHA|nr:polymer-forming cytoskeletal protein [Thermosporothrix hazakensis]PZW36808.1 hypothetical protein EI42_00994 [Thermosporothrix hazakensis]BBH89274.1 hypothetical protein KTC_40250 [Thermosporothrix sp. COM3]GCE47457.1 hypothetical protein KTH_23260 [Thermosporothrix hazakensis]
MHANTKRQQRMIDRARWLGLVFVLLLCVLLPTTSGTASAAARSPSEQHCTGEYHQPFFGKTVVITSGEVICSNLTVFGGTVVIRGIVRGDVVAFNSSVVIDGKIDGKVMVYAGGVTLQDNAHVNGDVHLCQSQWTNDNDSELHGSLFECTKSAGMVLLGEANPAIRFWFLLTWLALGALLTLLMPEHVVLVRTTITQKLRRSLVLGLLSVVLAPLFLAVLFALIVSIPLAIIVLVVLIAAWALGTVAVGSLIGEYIVHKLFPGYNTRLTQVVVGLTVFVLAGSLPYIGWLITLGAGLLGLGAVLLSRFGTRLYGQPRQPLPL